MDTVPPLAGAGLLRGLRSAASSPWWLLGVAVSVLGLVAQVLAFGRLAISIVQTIGIAGVVLLVVVSRVGFGEHLRRRELTGLGVAVVSLLLVTLSLTRSSDVAGTRGSSTIVLLAALAAAVMVAFVVLTGIIDRDADGFVYGCLSGILYGLAGLATKGLSTTVHVHHFFEGLWRSASTPFPYLFVGSWIPALIVFQLGIQRCRVGIVAPLSSMVSSVLVVALGTPVFGEHLPRQALPLTLRLVGFAGIVLGSAWVGSGPARPPQGDTTAELT